MVNLSQSDLEPRHNPPSHTNARTFKYHSGISFHWSVEEQLALQEVLATFASYSNIILYAKIATKIPTKTIRDIALRVKWMKSKQDGMRKKDDHNLTNKSKSQKEKIVDLAIKSSNSATQVNILPERVVDHTNKSSDTSAQENILNILPERVVYHANKSSDSAAQEELRMDNDGGISLEAILEAAKALLEHNKQLLIIIDGNLASIETLNLTKFSEHEINFFGQFLYERQEAFRSKLKEDNMVLFEEIRYNINRVLNATNSKQMPPLSDRLNETEKSSFLRWINNGLCSQLRI